MLFSKNTEVLRPGFELGKGGRLFQDVERDILRLIYWNDQITQSRLVDAMRTPQQTVSRIVKSLIDRNVLRQTNSVQQGRGKPGFELEPNPAFAYSFGLSILLDSIAVAALDFGGNIIAAKRRKITDMAIDNVLHHAAELKQSILLENAIPADKVLGIGVGISGFFSTMDGKMNTHHKLEEWAQVDIAEIVSSHFSLPTWVINDASAAAAGEGIAGIGRKFKNFVYFFISGAFGGGLISNGEMLLGTFGNAGELGDLIPPKFHAHPNLELLRRILLKHGIEFESVYDIATDFNIDWPGVDEWLFKVQDSLDIVATACSAILDTQAIIIGGHIPTELAKKLIPRIEVYAQYRRETQRPLPQIVPAQVTLCPVAVGAASLPLRCTCL